MVFAQLILPHVYVYYHRHFIQQRAARVHSLLTAILRFKEMHEIVMPISPHHHFFDICALQVDTEVYISTSILKVSNQICTQITVQYPTPNDEEAQKHCVAHSLVHIVLLRATTPKREIFLSFQYDRSIFTHRREDDTLLHWTGIDTKWFLITGIFHNIERWNCYWKFIQTVRARSEFGAMSAFPLAYHSCAELLEYRKRENRFFFRFHFHSIYIFRSLSVGRGAGCEARIDRINRIP